MEAGRRYRAAGIGGTFVAAIAAVGIVNHSLVVSLLTLIPIIGTLSTDFAAGNEFVFEAVTTAIVFMAALWPLYKPRPRRILDTITLVQKRVLLGTFALATIGYFDYTYRLPRLMLFGVAGLLFVVLPIWFVSIRQPVQTGATLLVGDDPKQLSQLYAATDHDLVGYVSPPILGYLDEEFLGDGGNITEPRSQRDDFTEMLPRLGGLGNLEHALIEHNIDTALLAFSKPDRGDFFSALDTCYDHGVTAKVHRDHADHVLIGSDGDGVIVDVDLRPLDLQNYVVKRLFDVAFAAVGLIALSPVIVVIAVAVKADSPGPVLYNQERTAAFGDSFTIYKFRSMVPNAEADTGVKLSDEDAGGTDPRVTRVGRVLRQTHLDEIPQLWSVLIGQMSVVGPRPERPDLDREIEADGVNWRRRWFVKPGLTGLAQVNRVTGFQPERKLRYDLEYIRKQGFWFDLKIVIRQVWLVLGDVKAMLRTGDED